VPRLRPVDPSINPGVTLSDLDKQSRISGVGCGTAGLVSICIRIVPGNGGAFGVNHCLSGNEFERLSMLLWENAMECVRNYRKIGENDVKRWCLVSKTFKSESLTSVALRLYV